jgi:hypothetical protein
MRRHSIRSRSARTAVFLLSLWLPAGPLLSAAGACERAAAAHCGHNQSRRIGCHDTAARPSCHESAQAAKPKPSCCCAKLTIAASRCGCRHDGGAVAVTIDNTIPRARFVMRHVLPARIVSSVAPRARDLVAEAPPVPPPRTLAAPQSI